ncbi:putative leucine-rich repeat receptor-like protein kinase At2g19210 [Hevea brasiliensis]|uniref:putative leucine-rich repeat receptor-like protein kinase At2g19210 n=1 Tax=Hevea brasiliensis TaxID=3981 RepID=UPI0025F6FC5B|nr:putative leucine-rich repeat receptor-like protein kinase At2g19210 [Hevea brasiliensis]
MDGWQRCFLFSILWLIFTPMDATFGSHKVTAAANNEPARGRKLATDNPGSISIDCGVNDDYVDDNVGLLYKSDRDFISTGENHDAELGSTQFEAFTERLCKNLRSFPTGRKNCYTLRPKQGKNHNYFIKTLFCYGNYDGKNQPPKFDLYIGVNYWITVEGLASFLWRTHELFHFSSTDTIHLCLVNTNVGVPFISALELHPVNDSIYRSEFGSLMVARRSQLSYPTDLNFRYKDDVFQRIWRTYGLANTTWVNATSDIQVQEIDDSYKLPIEVLKTAAQPQKGLHSLRYNISFICSPSCDFYVYFHFAEIVEIPQDQRREFTITLNMSQINILKKQLSNEKDLGAAKKILGIEITRKKSIRKLFLSKQAYIEKVLKRFNMNNAKPVVVPFAAHFKLFANMSLKTYEEMEHMSSVPY